VTIIEHMPMTNVGKIYKPELRGLAGQQVASALVDAVCTGLGLGAMVRPAVRIEGETGVAVLIDASAAGTHADALQAQLQEALGRLPIKTRVALV
jgi:fatty-acyl-CoA synthase